jgi:hypothetical protein
LSTAKKLTEKKKASCYHYILEVLGAEIVSLRSEQYSTPENNRCDARAVLDLAKKSPEPPPDPDGCGSLRKGGSVAVKILLLRRILSFKTINRTRARSRRGVSSICILCSTTPRIKPSKLSILIR